MYMQKLHVIVTTITCDFAACIYNQQMFIKFHMQSYSIKTLFKVLQSTKSIHYIKLYKKVLKQVNNPFETMLMFQSCL